MDVDGDFEPSEAVAAAAEEVIGFELGELKNVSPTSPSYVVDEVLVNAILVACLVHLKHVVLVLVVSKIFNLLNTIYILVRRKICLRMLI